jgi:hypothetical protein
MKKCLLLLLTVVIFIAFTKPQQVKAQNKDVYDEVIDPEKFDLNIFTQVLLFELNKNRILFGLDEFQADKDAVLTSAATLQADYMADNQQLTLENSKKKKTTALRVKKFGGSKNVAEFVTKMSIGKGKSYFTYRKLAIDIAGKWARDSKQKELLNNPKYNIAGIGATINMVQKEIYVSVVLGNFTSYNNGAKERNSLKVPFTKKQYKLKPYDNTTCKDCEKFNDYENLLNGLTIEEGKIYLSYDYIKNLNKIIKNKKDGLAIDIIQKEQFPCAGSNILDYNLINKGVMTKRMYSKKIYKKNLLKKEDPNKIKVCLGKVPAGLDGNIELNLIIIQNKIVCKTLNRKFIEQGTIDVSKKSKFLNDTTTYKYTPYVIKPDSGMLTFKIPFEQGKYNYKQEDIKPFLDSLDEPDFIIKDLVISAYSSLEGSDVTNTTLQKKRAESIVLAIGERQKDIIKTKIITSGSWEMFKVDIKKTKYDSLFSTCKTELEAKDLMMKNLLLNELEPVLKQHRFAQIVMRVSYDVSGDKEKTFVLSKFNKAVKQKDIKTAYNIQQFIFKKITSNKYSPDVLSMMVIPYDKQNTVLLLNKIILENNIKKDTSAGFCDNLGKLYKLENDKGNKTPNNYIIFDYLNCQLLYAPVGNEQKINDMQNQIEALYNSKIKKEDIDALNLEYQFKIIKALDTVKTYATIVKNSVEKIKTLLGVKDSTWENSYKLAVVMTKQKNYAYAMSLLDPYVYNKEVSEDFLFLYVSLCSQLQDRMLTNRFSYAMTAASKKNPKRFCDLFKEDKFSMLVLENPDVKTLHCTSCGGN